MFIVERLRRDDGFNLINRNEFNQHLPPYFIISRSDVFDVQRKSFFSM